MLFKKVEWDSRDIHVRVHTVGAVHQLHGFYTYVLARKRRLNIAFEINKCCNGEHSAFLIYDAFVILFVKLLRIV